MKEMLKKRWKIIVAVLVIVAAVLGMFWGLGYRGLPVARNRDAFIKWLEKSIGIYSAFYEVSEATSDSVTVEFGHRDVDLGNGESTDLYYTLVRDNTANMKIKFETGGSFVWPVSSEALQKAGWEEGVGFDLVNGKKQYITYNDAWERPMLIVSTERKENILASVYGPEYYEAPKFVACDKITNNSNLNDILDLGMAARYRFQDDGDRPTITVDYVVFGNGGKDHLGWVSFVIDAAKNRLIEVAYQSAR